MVKRWYGKNIFNIFGEITQTVKMAEFNSHDVVSIFYEQSSVISIVGYFYMSRNLETSCQHFQMSFK
mgnify:CR=1 FL=1